MTNMNPEPSRRVRPGSRRLRRRRDARSPSRRVSLTGGGGHFVGYFSYYLSAELVRLLTLAMRPPRNMYSKSTVIPHVVMVAGPFGPVVRGYNRKVTHRRPVNIQTRGSSTSSPSFGTRVPVGVYSCSV